MGDHGIKEQGTWQEIEARAGSVTRFLPKSELKNDNTLSTSFDKLNAQIRVKDEAAVDLARQTGDFALYGNIFVNAKVYI